MRKNMWICTAYFWIILVAGAVLTPGCKKDDQSNNGQSGSNSIKLPKQGTYTYHVHSTDGVDQDMTGTYYNQKDTANGKAVSLRYVIDTITVESSIFADASNTTYSITPPPTYWSTINTLQSMPGVTKFTVSGWPLFMTMKNNPSIGDAMIFTGGPVKMHMEATQDNTSLITDWTMKYQNGKAVAINVPITTDAGTFTCNEWAYEVQTDFTGGPISQTQVLKDTVWYAPDAGMVKSKEVSSNATSETILKKIQY